ncbi:hypothetical protein F5051DRAFT_463597 [Lentinula edodes]|nr:hypothetical protein F5051DRAFT_463597 [Lentinula edodes]
MDQRWWNPQLGEMLNGRGEPTSLFLPSNLIVTAINNITINPISNPQAGLNIKGHGDTDVSNNSNKWSDINSLMVTEKISILVAGEAHMIAEQKEDIEQMFGRNLKIFYSKLQNTANAAGIAIVLNRRLTNVEGIQTHEIVPGHAMLLETSWHNDEKLSILAIYAPNKDVVTLTSFWTKVRTFFKKNKHMKKPDFMIGDLKIVEEPLDPTPPTGQMPHHSRLDRIYCKTEHATFTFEWNIQCPKSVKADHDSVSVKFTSIGAPSIGKGRWTMPIHLMYDKPLSEFIQTKGMKIMEELDALEEPNQRTQENNAQTLWADFKVRMIARAREWAKVVIPKIEKDIANLNAKLETISNDPLVKK